MRKKIGRLLQDDSCNWYFVEEKDVDDFEEMKESEDWDEFDNRFGDSILEYDISCYQFMMIGCDEEAE